MRVNEFLLEGEEDRFDLKCFKCVTLLINGLNYSQGGVRAVGRQHVA